MSADEVARLWGLYEAVETAAVIARQLNRAFPSVNERMLTAGGIAR